MKKRDFTARAEGDFKLHSKGGQIKGLDVTFQMHIVTKVIVIVKYSKNGKSRKFKKKRKIGKTTQNGPKWKKAPI